MTSEDQELDQAVASIQKKFGEGSIMRMGDQQVESAPAIPTGSLKLDLVTGIMGYPRGRLIEVYGPESSGKTTIALQAIAEHQKHGVRTAFIDAEHAIDPQYAEALGVDLDSLLLTQPDTGEQALQITDSLVQDSPVGLVVIDSVAALTPKAEIEGEIGDSHVGLQARMLSQACRKLSGPADETKTTIIFINQIRMKIGVSFGSPETVPGGNALKFFTSMRLDVRRTGQLKDGEDLVGNQTKIKVAKNKHAPPFQEAHVELVYGEGISREAEILDLGVDQGVLSKSGVWFSYGETRLGQGKAKARDYLKQNPELAGEIEQAIRANIEGGASE